MLKGYWDDEQIRFESPLASDSFSQHLFSTLMKEDTVPVLDGGPWILYRGFIPPEHYGVDITGIKITGTKVRAPFNHGEVTAVYDLKRSINPTSGYGNGLAVTYKLKGLSFTITFGHFESLASEFNVGDKISKGDVLGFVGSTGRSTGPHLHIDIVDLTSKQYVNPMYLKSIAMTIK